MRPFLHGSLFVGIGAVLLASTVAFLARTAPAEPFVAARWTHFRTVTDDIEIVAIGNSHNRAIVFEAFDAPGYHLWRPGGDLFEARRILDIVVRRTDRLDVVLLPLSYFWLDQDNALTPEAAENRRLFYASTPGFAVVSEDPANMIRGKLAPLVRPDHGRIVPASVLGRLPPPLVSSTGWTGRRARIDTSVAHARRIDNLAGRRVKEHVVRARRMRAARPDLRDATVRTLDAIAETAAAYGLALVLYTPPYHRRYTEAYPPGEIAAAKAAATTIAHARPNVVYVDASEHLDFVDRADRFRDPDHLNYEGAAAFSALLRARLEALGVLP